MATYDQVPTTEMKDSELEVHELSNRPNNAELVPFSNKSSVFLTIILPTVVSLVLVVSTENGWQIRGQVFDWIEENRATTQIFVQIVAGILGVSQISTLRNLINYSARQKLLQRPVTLDTLNFYSSLTTSQINWSLPILPLAVVLSTATIAIIPAALWAGALTPVLAVSSETPQLHIPVPVWSNETKNLWEKHWYDRPNTNVTQTPLGIFSYGPHIDRYGFFLNDGSAASTLDGNPQKYKKSDNSNYTYHGRSYGVGSSIGLNDSFLTPDLHIANYTFFETGYLTRFKCIYNTSTEWALEISGTPWSQSLPQVYNVSTSSTLLTTEEGRTRSQTAFVAYKPADVLHLAAGSSHALLNATQCTATTTATNFSVAADVSTRLITVSPVAQAAAPDPEPSGLVARWAAETLVPLTWIGSTSFTSVPGDMLYRNVFNVRQQPTGEADADRVLRAVEESLDALFDLAMVAQASAQLVIARDAAPRPVQAVVRVLRVGQAAYVYAVLAVHVVVVALLAGEAARTGLWWQLPRLDFADVKSGIVASSAEVAERVRWEHGKFGGAWTGAPEDRVAGQVKVMLTRSKAGLLCMRPA